MARKTQKTDKQEEIKDKKVNGDTGNDTEYQGDTAAEERDEQEQSPGNKQGGQSEEQEHSADEQDVQDEAQARKEEEPAKSPEELLEEKVADLQDKYLRLSAEYDNYRKRTLREKMELQENAREDIFVNILPVVDDLERALEVVDTAKDIKAVKEGMKLIHTKFSNYLKQQGVKEIEALDLALDTDLHEAVTKIPVDSKKKKGKVVDVIEKGYMLRDKVIRFAKVVIGE